MIGYFDGVCDILFDEFEMMLDCCNFGKVSYFGGYCYLIMVLVSGSLIF